MVNSTQTKRRQRSGIHTAALVFGVALSISVFFLAPSHFSVAAFSVIVFCAYSFYANSLLGSTKAVRTAHTAVLLVLMYFVGTSLAILLGLYGPSCAAFFGQQVKCNTYEDLIYAYAEVVGSIVVIASLYILQESHRKQLYARS